MNQLLQLKQHVQLTSSNAPCEVQRLLGGGGQGEVYQAIVNGQTVALKWYYPQQATAEQRAALELLIKRGAPNDKFLWPIELASAPDVKGFGYLMPLRAPQFKSLVDLMKGRINPSFRALATAGLELAHSFLLLHAEGLCYRDISFGNVFFDHATGAVLICDNDNVTVDGAAAGGILGTPRFMAPEIVRGDALPDTASDLFSLAVLLFYLFMVHHPLEGQLELQIKCFDLPAMIKLYGTAPVFIFDPQDASNRPAPGYQDNALVYWPLYPQFLRDLFTKAFTAGLCDPAHGRVRESEWRAAMVRLRDSILYCGQCGAENFYDSDQLQAAGQLNPCWSCQQPLTLPPRIRIEKQVIMLNHDTQLFPHHLDPQQAYNFAQPVAAVTRHPQNPKLWGLQNLSLDKWVITTQDGSIKDVEPGRNAPLAAGVTINFGKTIGAIRA